MARACAEHDAVVAHATKVTTGLALGTARNSAGTDVLVRLPHGQEAAHAVITGATGSGKTTAVCGAWLPQRYTLPRPAVATVDGKGDMFGLSMRAWAQYGALRGSDTEREAMRKRPFIVDLSARDLPAFNVLRTFPGETAEARAYDVTLALDRYFGSIMGSHQESSLRNGCVLAIEHGLTLPDLVSLFENDTLRGWLASQSKHREVREFFLRTWHTGIPERSKETLVSRLRALLFSESLRLALSADDLIDLPGILDRGDPIWVFCGRGPNLAEEQARGFASLLVQLLLTAAYNRGTGQRRRYILVLDEVGQLVDAPAVEDRLVSAMSIARTFGLSIWTVFQHFQMISPKLRDAIVTNADVVALFRTSRENILPFGDFLPAVDPEMLRQTLTDGSAELTRGAVRRRQLEAIQRLDTGACVFYDRRRPHRAIWLNVPDVDPPHKALGMREGEFERWLHDEGWDVGAGRLSREAIRAQIAARERRLLEQMRPPIMLASTADTASGGPRRIPSRRPPLVIGPPPPPSPGDSGESADSTSVDASPSVSPPTVPARTKRPRASKSRKPNLG